MKQKVAVISGAASGIGLASARRFAAEHYALALIDIDPALEQYVAELSEQTAVVYRVADVSDEAAVQALFAEAHEKFGRIDVVNSNAGIVLVQPLEQTPMDGVMRTLQVNLGGCFAMTKAAIPYFKEQRFGAIVNLGSISGHVGQMYHSIYGASKAAVIAFTRAVAWELAPYGIRVNSVSPGSVNTPMLRGDVMGESQRLNIPYETLKKEREAEQAFNRWAEPSEIADAIFYLAGEQASFITGTDLLVDCGWAAK